MSYQIRRSKVERDAIGNYQYEILHGKKVVAKYWHDFRGDAHGIEFVGGKKEGCPGSMINFLSGGGPKPVELTSMAIKYLCEKMS
ncbi:hypothetical protein [uncultured Spongiibacter sp.]|uniref:hypothetical protein n=1 Tax=uncultured Spongiibacter sp. TaxID=870896 RepID=UPI00258A0D5F|nr:hypothetical protein [uncultured Spongiibacter sp.]